MAASHSSSTSCTSDCAAVLGPGAGDRDVDVGEQGLDLRRASTSRSSGTGSSRLAGAALPPLAGQLARGPGQPGPVTRLVASCQGPVAGAAASGRWTTSVRVAVGVVGGVPAVRGDVDAAGEGQAVVDDHDLLVVRAADRVVGVDAEVEPVGGAAVQQHDRREARGRARAPCRGPTGGRRSPVPGSRPTAFSRTAPSRSSSGRPPSSGSSRIRGSKSQPMNRTRRSRTQHGPLQGGEVVGRVDEDREAGRRARSASRSRRG